MTDEKVIKAQLEIIQGYYGRIVTGSLTIEQVIEMLEDDLLYLRQEFGLLEVEKMLNEPIFPADRSTKHMDA
jgi:hypothetical protein